MTTPRVSIIVPNYNHAPFIQQRLDTILQQTYQHFEIILLDDASTDDSRAVMAPYLQDPRVNPLYNTTNTGMPGIQWNRGVAQARGAYVWIAESDDYADPGFLETMVGRLDAFPTAGLAYCQSWQVDEHNTITGSYTYAIQDLYPDRWQQDYFNHGEDESRYFAYENIIPNASAVLFRKSVYDQVGGASEQVRYGSDWLLWVKMLMVSDVVFVAEPLNCFRQHSAALSATRHHATPGPVNPPLPPFSHAPTLRRWPARMFYILGRNALRTGNVGEARQYFRHAFRVYPFPSTALFWGASFLGRGVYQGLDGIKMRKPGLGRLAARLNVFWLRLRQIIGRVPFNGK